VTVKILQIVSVFQNYDVQFLPPRRTLGTPHGEMIIGMALVEYLDGGTGIEWVVWDPATRIVKVSTNCFDRHDGGNVETTGKKLNPESEKVVGVP